MITQQPTNNDKLQMLQDGIARLKLEFIATLPHRVAALDGMMDELYQKDADIEQVIEAIGRQAHKLHGQAGTFGFGEVGSIAARLEQEVITALEGPRPLSTEEIEGQLVALLDVIEASVLAA